MNNHRNKSYKVNEKSTFELKHFNIHEFHNVKIQIIEQIVDEDLRLKSENFYILRFKTLYPYGLNTKLNHHPVNVDCIYSLFSSVYIPSFRYNRGKRGNHTNKALQNKYHNVIPAIILQDLYNLFNANYCATYIKNVLFGLKFKILRKLQLAIQKFNCDNKQFIDLINDVLLYKIGEIKQTHTDKAFFVFTFQQKSFDYLRMSLILDKHKSDFPINYLKIIPTFKYTATIGKMLFNYRTVAQNLDEHITTTCDCEVFENSPFYDNTFKHIITGEMNFITDMNLRVFLRFGTKFRINKKLNHEKSYSIFKSELEKFILGISYKFNKPLPLYINWKNNILHDFTLFLKGFLNSSAYDYHILGHDTKCLV